MKLYNIKYTFALVTIISVFASCSLFTGGDSDTRGSVIIDKSKEVTLDGNSGKRFDILTGKSTGISFVNDLTENYEVNWWRYSYIYNGGGVAIGDVNNDGLQDLFFTGNIVPNKLYLNKGNLQFEDVTDKAGIVKESWEFTYGATMADIDGDGDMDIYICNSRWDNPEKRKNRLWINNGDMTFVEKSAEFGLDDDSYSTHANFFDYDNDGDLDMYLVTHPVDFIDKNKTKYFQKIEKGVNLSDHFYRNDNGKFVECHLAVGINNHGYGLSGSVADLNEDGFLDVFVTNDYAMYDFIYINNGDGTFRDESLKAVKKTSINSMGSDVADFNNDGFQDIIVADMDMEDNYTYKTFMLSSQVEVMRILINAGYGYQNRSNSLQLNNGDGTFGEISRTAGVATTDWSWSTLLADFDNDGYKDLFISNGFLRDFHVDESETYHKLRRAVRIEDSTVYYEVREKLPHYVLSHPNFIFKNNGDLTFKDTRDEWGIYYPSITYGAGYADLDNDGDLDIISSNVNETPWIYRNNSEKDQAKNNFLNFTYTGYKTNSHGFGTKVRIYYGDQMQYIQHTGVRGYITSLIEDTHFGLGQVSKVDLVEIEWLDGSKQVLKDVAANQTIELKHADASKTVAFSNHNTVAPTFKKSTADLGIDYVNKDNEYDDFLREYLLPHKMSALNPGIAVADVNGDGLEDFYVGGTINTSGAIYVQGTDGKFKKSGFQQTNPDDLKAEDGGAIFFDVDLDGDNDLYVSSGGNEHAIGDANYIDRLYINDGNGNFTRNSSAVPDIRESSSVVTAADFDKDGDLDLFVGGRQVPGKYLESASSYILRNDAGKLTDVTAEIAPALSKIGMVTSALWSDFNNDNTLDLVITGDWMQVTFLKNNAGKFTDATADTGLKNSDGWYQSITGADIDLDGDIDYVIGNFGTNRRYKNTTSVADGSNLPLEGYLADFDKNGSEDLILAYYQHDKLYPVKTRERLIEQLPEIDKEFPTWDEFGKATLSEIFGEKELKNAIHKQAYNFRSCVLLNQGNGKFTISYLPNETQISVLFGMVVDDFNADGYPDILAHGNFYNTDIEVTRHDSGTGILLLGKGDGTFTPIRSYLSGLKNDGDAKGMSAILNAKKQPVFLLANTSGPLEAFSLTNANITTVSFTAMDAMAEIQMKNGRTQKMELYNGSGYLSQSSKYLRITPEIVSVTVTDYAGKTRTVYPASLATK